jgi:protein LTV1
MVSRVVLAWAEGSRNRKIDPLCESRGMTGQSLSIRLSAIRYSKARTLTATRLCHSFSLAAASSTFTAPSAKASSIPIGNRNQQATMGKSKNKTKPFIDKRHATTYSILPKTQAELALLGEEEATTADPDAATQDAWNELLTSDYDPFAQWKGRLRQAGIALSEDELAHRYLKELGGGDGGGVGGGVFVDARSGRTGQVAAAAAARDRRLQHPGWTEEPDDPNSAILFDNVDLTLDCMDEDMKMILMLADDGDMDDVDIDGALLEAGELDDDFCLQAAQDPVDDKSGGFDYDAHIRQLLERARRERDDARNGTWGEDKSKQHPGLVDREYFAETRNGSNGRDDDADDDEEEEYDDADLNEWMNQQQQTRSESKGGVSSRLHPDEERALCDKFLATLAEYEEEDDSDDGSDEYGEEAGEVNNNAGRVFNADGGDDDSNDQQSVGDEDDEDDVSQDIGRGRGLGDDELEAALDDFLRENDDEILIQRRTATQEEDGARRRNEAGGSGYAVLVGTRMVPAVGLKHHAVEPEEHDAADPPETIAEVLAEADATLNAPIEFLTLDEVITVDEFDGNSYFTERTRNPWDCESILSTYSNLDNNPAVIQHASSRRRKNRVVSKNTETTTRIVLSAKTGLPILQSETSPEEQLDKHDDGVSVGASTIGANRGVARNKDETKDEKRARKMAAKQERQMSQLRKKALRDAFGQELQKRSVVATTDGPVGSAVFRYT